MRSRALGRARRYAQRGDAAERVRQTGVKSRRAQQPVEPPPWHHVRPALTPWRTEAGRCQYGGCGSCNICDYVRLHTSHPPPTLEIPRQLDAQTGGWILGEVVACTRKCQAPKDIPPVPPLGDRTLQAHHASMGANRGERHEGLCMQPKDPTSPQGGPTSFMWRKLPCRRDPLMAGP
jgi:hypothetical protein